MGVITYTCPWYILLNHTGPHFNIKYHAFCVRISALVTSSFQTKIPDSKVHWPNMGPIWGRKDPGGPHVDPMNLAIWDITPSDRHYPHTETYRWIPSLELANIHRFAFRPLWRHKMETFSLLLSLCARTHRSLVDSPHKRTVTRSFGVSLLSIWTNSWTNTRLTNNARRHNGHLT